MWLQAVAFGLVLLAAYLQYRGNIEASLPLVWSSIAVSGIAVLTAVTSVVVPGRDADPSTVDGKDVPGEGPR